MEAEVGMTASLTLEMKGSGAEEGRWPSVPEKAASPEGTSTADVPTP